MARAYYPSGDSYIPWDVDMVGISDSTGAVRAGSTDPITSIEEYCVNQQSFMGSTMLKENSEWWNLISCRHRNNTGDGPKYGMAIYAPMTNTAGTLYWNNQTAGKWGAPRRIIDSNNAEVVVSTSQPTNSNAKIWVKI